MPEWFEEWFGEEYLHLYPHRDSTDAERLVALLGRAIPWQPGWTVLDVACGAGRHMAALERIPMRTFGLDLSQVLLLRAREVTVRPLVRADMRALPLRAGRFDLAVNLFTSFGYFDSDNEHADAMGQMIAVLRPAGWFAMDFLNATHVRQSLVPREQTRLAGAYVDIRRELSPDGRFVTKRIATGTGQTFVERVRLLSAVELEAMIRGAGAEVTGRFGDYDGGALGPGPRTILVARRRS